MIMKKKIFIFSHAMEIGGAERALLGLLNSIDYSKYDVDLFLLRHSGDLMDLIPEQVNLLPEIPQYSALMMPMIQALKSGQIAVVLGRLVGKIKAKIFNRRMGYKNSLVSYEYSHKYTKKYMPMITDKKYDIAISFLIPHYFVIEKVKAVKKIAWIHTDYSFLKLNIKSETKMWSAYDNIISISDDVTKAFLTKFPKLENKIVKIENIISKDFIEKQSKEKDVSDEMSKDKLSFLSVGRFSEAKNFDNIPEICSMIINKNYKIKWYIIGYGEDEELIRKKIKEYNMEQHVILLGKKDNPYPYIKQCDIYVQPSRFEGKAVTVREAQILHKPVAITDFPTAYSQLEDGIDGIIVPQQNKECADELMSLIENKRLQDELIENCKNKNYSNTDEVEKIYKMI